MCKENIIKTITSYFVESYEDDDEKEEFIKFVNDFKFYAKVRDEEWNMEKAKEKVKQLEKEIEKLTQIKNEWKEV